MTKEVVAEATCNNDGYVSGVIGGSGDTQNQHQQQQHPNIIFILTDDQGYGEVGFTGNKDIRTPNIDLLSTQSINFNDFHVGTTCAPTRSGLLTGHYCNSAGVWHTIGGRSLLRENEWTLPQALKELGNYRTGHFGKWHLGDTYPYRSFERGFDYSIYHGGGGIGNTPDSWGNDYFDDIYQVNGIPTQFKGYCTDVFFEEAQKFILLNSNNEDTSQQEEEEQPFFCYIATNAPHAPFNVEDKYTNLYHPNKTKSIDRACFYGMVTNIDENVGKLRNFLQKHELDQSTIIIFMSDNGSGGGVSCNIHGHVDESIPCNYNAGMRGMKGHEYEGGHRVPFLLHIPNGLLSNMVGGGGENEGHDNRRHYNHDVNATSNDDDDDDHHHHGVYGGRIVSELTSYIDFMPTILDICGVSCQIPENRNNFHGVSLGPTIRGWEQPELLCRSVVVDTQRIARPVKWHRSCVMQNKWRLINGEELYNITTDPSQVRDVAKDNPKKVRSLRKSYEVWWELVSKQFYLDSPFVIDGGTTTCKELHLSTHDIRNEASDAVWNQGQVRTAQIVSGYWPIDVRKVGIYEIELFRWPKSTSYGLRHGIDGDDSNWRKDCIQPKYKELYENGVSLDLKWAHIEISDGTNDNDVMISLHQQIKDDNEEESHADSEKTRNNNQKSFLFEVNLQSLGIVKLFAGFYERKNNRTIAPYYVHIREKKA